jgi:hypothetical protein
MLYHHPAQLEYRLKGLVLPSAAAAACVCAPAVLDDRVIDQLLGLQVELGSGLPHAVSAQQAR